MPNPSNRDAGLIVGVRFAVSVNSARRSPDPAVTGTEGLRTSENVEPERETCGQLACGVGRPAHSDPFMRLATTRARLGGALIATRRSDPFTRLATTRARLGGALIATRRSDPFTRLATARARLGGALIATRRSDRFMRLATTRARLGGALIATRRSDLFTRLATTRARLGGALIATKTRSRTRQIRIQSTIRIFANGPNESPILKHGLHPVCEG